MTAGEIAQALAGRIPEVVQALAGERHVTWGHGFIRLGNRGSIAIETRPPRAGVWCNHEDGIGGDALDLVRHLRGGSIKDALRWASAWMGGARAAPVRSREKPDMRTPDRVLSQLWRTIWQTSEEGAGSPAARYLASRGLRWPEHAPLRFHHACPRAGDRLPAMVALMTDPVTNAPVGIHRTFLRPDGSGKADVQPAKMMLGAAGIIRLVPDEEVNIGLGVSEGIETGLALMQHAGWRPVWAASSAGAISRFSVLNGIESLTIFADCDDKGAGLLAAWGCAERWSEAGREVTIQQPPAGTDWHDALGGRR